MGLDQYAYLVREEDLNDEIVDLEDCIKDGITDFAFDYWRKFYPLQEYMANMYFSRGGKSITFNCAYMKFLKEDLDYLEEEAKKAVLLQVGYFADHCKGLDVYVVTDLLKFVSKSRSEMEKGNAVIYSSWW